MNNLEPRSFPAPEVLQANPVKHVQFSLMSVTLTSNLGTVKGGLQGTEWRSLNYFAVVHGIH